MAVRVITAPPGHGKTLNMTQIAIESFYKTNNIFNKISYKLHKEEFIYNNNIYSNYPILLKKSKKPFKYENGIGVIKDSVLINEDGKKYSLEDEQNNRKKFYGCFANKIRFTDMRLKWKFKENSSFFIDEIQYIYDSMDYKDFPDCIAHFFQVHRHLSYQMIYTNSQSLSRIIKRVLCISEEFWNIINLKNFLFWTIVDIKITTEIAGSKEAENSFGDFNSNADFIRKIFLHKKVFNGYNNKYLESLNDGLPYYSIGEYDSITMNKKDILAGFMVTNEEKEELKHMLF